MIFPSEQMGLTPYIAGGYHRWLRDFAGGGDSGYIVDGYPETYQFAWYALGFLVQYSPCPSWVLNIDASAGTMENVTNKSWTWYNQPNSYQKLLTLKQRFIYNLGVGSDYQFARHWHALTEINYWYFKYGKSANSPLPNNNFWFEPNSTTRQLSIMLGIGYAI